MNFELCPVFLAVYSLFADKDITHSLPYNTKVIKGLNRTKDQLYIIYQFFFFFSFSIPSNNRKL